MSPETLADALDLDEHAPQRHRLLVAALTLVADISIERQHRLGAINFILETSTPTETAA